MKKLPDGIIVLLLTTVILVSLSCTADGTDNESESPDAGEPVVLEEGSTEINSDFYVDDNGRIIYYESRETIASEDVPSEEPEMNLPPVYSGAQRIFPGDEDASKKRTYLARAPLELVEDFYRSFLATGAAGDGDETEEDVVENVQNISLTDEDGLRAVTLFLNEEQGIRGGMKVMLKEHPSLSTVEIVLTTLNSTPWQDVTGQFVSSEEVRQWAAEYQAMEDERQRQLDELNEEAVNNEEFEGTSDTDDGGDE